MRISQIKKIEAIKKSIAHHEENLLVEKKAGCFMNFGSSHFAQRGDFMGSCEFYYDYSHCALCKLCYGHCDFCPLGCYQDSSCNALTAWGKIKRARTIKEFISAEINMLKILKRVLKIEIKKLKEVMKKEVEKHENSKM